MWKLPRIVIFNSPRPIPDMPRMLSEFAMALASTPRRTSIVLIMGRALKHRSTAVYARRVDRAYLSGVLVKGMMAIKMTMKTFSISG
jgi:hypothetical protein